MVTRPRSVAGLRGHNNVSFPLTTIQECQWLWALFTVIKEGNVCVTHCGDTTPAMVPQSHLGFRSEWMISLPSPASATSATSATLSDVAKRSTASFLDVCLFIFLLHAIGILCFPLFSPSAVSERRNGLCSYGRTCWSCLQRGASEAECRCLGEVNLRPGIFLPLWGLALALLLVSNSLCTLMGLKVAFNYKETVGF